MSCVTAMHMARTVAVAAFGLLLSTGHELTSSAARAQAAPVAPPPPGMLAPAPAPRLAPPPPPSAAPKLDTVVLRDGRTLQGTILQHEPTSHLALRLPDGRDMLLSAGIVQQVIRAAAPSVPPAGLLTPGAPVAAGTPPTHVTVERQTQLDTTRGTLSHEVRSAGELERTLLDVNAGTARRETVDAHGNVTSMEVSAAGTASYNAVSDCSDPSSPVCRRETDVNLSSGGLMASHSETRVQAVAEPPSSYSLVSIGLGVTALFGAFDAFGGNLSASLRGGFGGQLPGAEGGTWGGLGYDLGVQLSYISGDFGESGQVNMGVAAGWTGFSFGTLDPATLEQSGFGWLLGGRLGVNTATESGSEPSLSVGPQITLTLPTYNAGTASVSDTSLSLFILPTGDVTIVMVQLGFGSGV